MDATARGGSGRDAILPAERFTAFTDAVIAIAMTLLILPLMESVNDFAGEGTASQWLADESPKLLSFALSFLLIAVFWVGHHRLSAGVERVDSGLLWLTLGWMFTIVWLPVATAISGQLPVDAVQKLLYTGTLTLTSVMLWAIRIHLVRHPDLWREGAEYSWQDVRAHAVTPVLFVLATISTAVVPEASYFPLLLLLLAGPVKALIDRRTASKR